MPAPRDAHRANRAALRDEPADLPGDIGEQFRIVVTMRSGSRSEMVFEYTGLGRQHDHEHRIGYFLGLVSNGEYHFPLDCVKAVTIEELD